MDLIDTLTAIRRNWLVIVLTAILGCAFGLVLTILQTPQYQSSASVFVSAQSAASVADLTSGSDFAQELVKSYTSVGDSQYVLNGVIKQLGLKESAADLKDQIALTAGENEVVINVTATDPSPTRAANLANSVARQLSLAAGELTPVPRGEVGSVRLTLLDGAVPPERPIRPDTLLNLLFGAAAGLLLGLGLAALRKALDNRVHNSDDVKALTDRPVLASIVRDPSAREQPLLASDARGSRAEGYRILRANLEFLDLVEKRRSVVITSSLEGEGKSTSAGNLAIALAASGQRVLLVDADLRRPQMANYFGVNGAIGLSDVLIGAVDFKRAVTPWGAADNLHLLTAGRTAPNPADLLQSEAMTTLMEDLATLYDLIIYDAPPVLPVADAALLARRAGGAIVTCAADTTQRKHLISTLDALDQIGARTLGVVLTMVPKGGPDVYTYVERPASSVKSKIRPADGRRPSRSVAPAKQ